jgi:hypothetical protein
VRITSVETIPVSVRVGKFEDGADMVMGTNAPDRYYRGRSLVSWKGRDPDDRLLL